MLDLLYILVLALFMFACWGVTKACDKL